MKISKGLAVFILSVFILTSCKDDDGGNSYELAQFEGTWELSNSTSSDFEECESNPPILVISQNNITFPVIGSEGCDSGDLETEYEFNGSNFSINLFGQNVTYSIVSASSPEFVWEDNFEGAQETWVKVN
jgi:hypothetical protein